MHRAAVFDYQINKQLKKRALIKFYSDVVFAQGVYGKAYRGRNAHC
jgi:hypothetical protein